MFEHSQVRLQDYNIDKVYYIRTSAYNNAHQIEVYTLPAFPVLSLPSLPQESENVETFLNWCYQERMS